MGIAERTGIIWTPGDDIDLLSVSVDDEADQSDIAGMININQAARDWLDKTIDIRDYCDILQLNGIINPYELIGEFCDHTELIMKMGMK